MAIQLKQYLLGLIAMAYFGVVAAECDLGTAECFSDAGLASWYKTVTSRYPETSFYESAFLENADVVCKKTDQLAQVANCMLTNAFKCLPQLKVFMSKSDAMDKAMKHLCANIKNMNLKCLDNKRKEFTQCGNEMGKNLSSTVKLESGKPIPQEAACQVNSIVSVCQNKTLRSCGCQTLKTALDITDILTPKSCPALDDHVTCSSENPNEFADGGATGIYSFWTWNILIAFLVAANWSRFY